MQPFLGVRVSNLFDVKERVAQGAKPAIAWNKLVKNTHFHALSFMLLYNIKII